MNKQAKKLEGKRDKRPIEEQAVASGKILESKSLIKCVQESPEESLSCCIFSSNSLKNLLQIYQIDPKDRFKFKDNSLLNERYEGFVKNSYTLPRQETVVLYKNLQKNNKTLLLGPKGIGKSTLLLQAQLLASQNNFLVIPWPDGDLLTGNMYAYRFDSKKNEWFQDTLARQILNTICAINKSFESIKLSKEVKLQHKSFLPDFSIGELMKYVSLNPHAATRVFDIILEEILMQKIPTLMTMDNYDFLAIKAKYKDRNNECIDPLKFHLAKQFTKLFSTQNSANVLVAQSNGISSESFDVFLGMRPYNESKKLESRVQKLLPESLISRWPIEKRVELLEMAKQNVDVVDSILYVSNWQRTEAQVYANLLKDLRVAYGSWDETIPKQVVDRSIIHSGNNPKELERVISMF